MDCVMKGSNQGNLSHTTGQLVQVQLVHGQLCLVLTGLLRYGWAYVAGSVLQVLLILAGLVVPVMFFLGAVFAALWVLAIYLGRRVARLQADRGPEPG